MIRKYYVDSPVGQLHVRSNSKVVGPTLVCLHATAYSGKSFHALMSEFEGQKHVIAVDMPGYGNSDRPKCEMTISDFADAMTAAIGSEPVDLFGYHTGVYIAVEMALRNASRVRRVAMMGVPYFQALDFDYWYEKLASPHSLSDELSQFEERWQFLVKNRPQGLTLERGFENFVDELLAWPYGTRAHQALFSYDSEPALKKMRNACLILNPRGHLAEPSALAAKFLRHAKLVELPELNGAVLDAHAANIKHELDLFLA